MAYMELGKTNNNGNYIQNTENSVCYTEMQAARLKALCMYQWRRKVDNSGVASIVLVGRSPTIAVFSLRRLGSAQLV